MGKSSTRAKNKWNKQHYKMLRVWIGEGDRERLAAAADGQSIADYLFSAVNADQGHDILTLHHGQGKRQYTGKTPTLNVSINLEEADTLSEIAKAEGKSVSGYIRDCVNQYAGETLITTQKRR